MRAREGGWRQVEESGGQERYVGLGRSEVSEVGQMCVWRDGSSLAWIGCRGGCQVAEDALPVHAAGRLLDGWLCPEAGS